MKIVLNVILIVFLLYLGYIGSGYIYSLIEKRDEEKPQKKELLEVIPSQPGDFKSIEKTPIVIKAVSYKTEIPKNTSPNAKNGTVENQNSVMPENTEEIATVKAVEKTEDAKENENTASVKKNSTEEVKCVKIQGMAAFEGKNENADSGRKANPLLRFGDHCYRIFEEDIRWEEAKRKCENLGGYLACIESKPENDFLFNSVKNIDGLVLLGGFYDEKEKKWRWVNNSLLIYCNWSGRQPESFKKKAHRAVLSPLNGKDKWFYYSGSRVQGFICEWDEDIEENSEVADKNVSVEEKTKPVKQAPVRFKNLAEFETLLTKVEREYREIFHESENSLSFKEHMEDLVRLKFIGRNLQSEVMRMGVKGDVNIPKYTFILQDTIEKARQSVNLKNDPGALSLAKKYKPFDANNPNSSTPEKRLIRQAAAKDMEMAITHLKEMLVIIKAENEN